MKRSKLLISVYVVCGLVGVGLFIYFLSADLLNTTVCVQPSVLILWSGAISGFCLFLGGWEGYIMGGNDAMKDMDNGIDSYIYANYEEPGLQRWQRYKNGENVAVGVGEIDDV